MKHTLTDLPNARIIPFLVDGKYRLLRHIILSITLLALIYYSNWLEQYNGPFKYYRMLCVFVTFVTMSYINMYLLVPKFFFRGQYLIYLLLIIALGILGIRCLSIVLNNYLDPEGLAAYIRPIDRYRGAYEGTLISIPIIFLTTTVKLFQRWTSDNKKVAELQSLTLTMELNELKNQINPHFLFNMLNGIKALTRINPEKAATVIVSLSEFLRYQLYENNEEKTSLKAEMNFLTNFLDLEKIRRDNFSVAIGSNTDRQVLHNAVLPPNIFTTFVENALKHSATIRDNSSHIHINIDIENDHLHFKCINSVDPSFEPPNQKSGGLGLANIQRRLQLLYRDQYQLNIQASEKEYQVNLTIPL